MDAKDRRYLQKLVESDDGTFVDGDDVALNRDPNDPRLNELAAHVRELQEKLKAAYRSAQQFRKISEILVLLPEQDPRRLDGMTTEIDSDVSVIVLACERLQPRLKAALEILGTNETDKDTSWV